MIMTRKGWRWAVCLALLFASCQRQPAVPEIHFIDGSQGLPRTGQWRERVTVADLDGDQRPEIIAPAARNEPKPRPHIWSRNAQGQWEEWADTFPPWQYAYGDVTVADFDQDGHLDLALAGHGTGLAILLARADRKWELAKAGLPPANQFSTRALAAGDLDGDGWSDLVAIAEISAPGAKNPTGVRAYLNQKGQGWKEEEIQEARQIHGDRVVTANGLTDGRAAVIIGSLFYGYPHIVWAREEAAWKSLSEGIPDNLLFLSASTCDLLSDGRPDLFLATDSNRVQGDVGPRVFSWEGGRWKDLSAGLPATPMAEVAGGDLEGNGRCALAALIHGEGSIHLFRHLPEQKKWEQWKTLARPTGLEGRPAAILIADADGDGRKDLVVNYSADPGKGGIHVWLNRLGGEKPQ